jgi:LacI family transcriptional regulator
MHQHLDKFGPLCYCMHQTELHQLQIWGRMNRNAVTIADVAERAGVSKTTVSHALSGKRPVAPETKARISQVIQELGFRPNQMARSLRMQQTKLVALIIPDITNPFYPALARGLQNTLREQEYSMILCNTDGLLQQEIAFITDAIYRPVDGIALALPYDRTEELREVIKSTVPIVTIGEGIIHPTIDRVAADDHRPINQAIQYLLDRGHRRIAMLAGPPDYTPTQFRLASYREALEQAQIPFRADFVVQGDFTRAGGERGMRTLLERFPRRAEGPSAVFCANDLIAIGAMHIAHETGLSVPADLAIIGFDDIEAASLIMPPLTTILLPAQAMGQISGQWLLERMQKRYHGPGRQAVVVPRFVRRESA